MKVNSRPKRCSTILVSAIVLFSMVLVSAPSSGDVFADVFIVHLKNGNQFLSKYRPREAHYDESKVLIVTDVGNTIALAKDSIDRVVNDREHRGFGVAIDTTTILVGYMANDAPEPGELPDGQAAQQPFPGFLPPSVINSPLISEPNSGSGIPISFISGGLIPTSPPIGAVRP